jgi:hypothetical protein
MGEVVPFLTPSRWWSWSFPAPRQTHGRLWNATAAAVATPGFHLPGWDERKASHSWHDGHAIGLDPIRPDATPGSPIRKPAVRAGRPSGSSSHPYGRSGWFCGHGPSVVPPRPGAGIRVSRSGGGLLGSLPSPFPSSQPSAALAGPEPLAARRWMRCIQCLKVLWCE